MYMPVNERSRSLNLCGPFVRAVLATKVEVSTRTMAADGTTKVLQHQGVFHHQNCTLGSLHDSEHSPADM